MHERIHAPEVFGRQIFLCVEIRGGIYGAADRRNDSETRNDDASLRQALTSTGADG
jgi:hypothetical protein